LYQTKIGAEGFVSNGYGYYMAVNRSFEKGPIPPAPNDFNGVLEAEALAEAAAASVRPTKVAKARKLIAQPAYPTKTVVKSLARQIARFF
jgi:hypothetical protein